MVPKVKAGKFLLGRRGPLDDQGVLIPVVVREDPNDPKPYRLVESESPGLLLLTSAQRLRLGSAARAFWRSVFPIPFRR